MAQASEPQWKEGGLKRWVVRPVLTVLAVLYFLIDAVVLAAIRPLAAWIGRLRLFARITAWISRLGPYPTLALFVVPLIILEPAKPVGFYLLGTGHAVQGVLVIGIAEVLKVTLVERLFRISKDKLLTIPAFAWCYVRVVRWLDWLTSLPPWVAVKRVAARVREAARHRLGLLRGWVWRLAKRG
ncbi:hypothetical protein [Azospirillum sp. sgz302134]